ncbi:hypothetical protein SAZ11_57150 [Streptomyces sp. FXJ1.4098]|nr:hypothetical protein [Streptomyces sp. FXJ1.4098]
MGGLSGLGRLLGGTDLTADQRKILDYAVEHSGSARISLAVEGGANGASTFILNSDATVIGMGGFIGTDDAPSVHQLETWTSKGELRYVLGSDSRSAALPSARWRAATTLLPSAPSGSATAAPRSRPPPTVAAPAAPAARLPDRPA